MKWMIIVFMLSGDAQPGTPLWSPEVFFCNSDECQTFLYVNKDLLFYKAIEAYEGELPPSHAGCIREDNFKQIIEGDVNDDEVKHSI